MTFGVFMHKDGSIYDDIPEVHYQFPQSYLSRAERMVGVWIVYREPVKLPQSKGLLAFGRLRLAAPTPPWRRSSGSCPIPTWRSATAR